VDQLLGRRRREQPGLELDGGPLTALELHDLDPAFFIGPLQLPEARPHQHRQHEQGGQRR